MSEMKQHDNSVVAGEKICQTCTHWRPTKTAVWGECYKIEDVETGGERAFLMSRAEYNYQSTATLNCRFDFGCAEWAATLAALPEPQS